ncbi:hypothetical protein OJ936_11640, partial [Streptococcus anginosus]|nr:hypothetical protein [Streptococcus anginosus]
MNIKHASKLAVNLDIAQVLLPTDIAITRYCPNRSHYYDFPLLRFPHSRFVQINNASSAFRLL